MKTEKGIFVACIAALGMLMVALPKAAHDDHNRVTPPAVPDKLQVSAQEEAFLIGHAVGTQNYVCLPAGTGFAWNLFTPEATLFNDRERQLITHYFSINPNPSDNGAIRATWQDSNDSSTVWGAVTGTATFVTDPGFVKQGAIAWLLVDVVGQQEGPRGGDNLTRTTSIQRVNTEGGSAPSTGCAVAANVGAKAFVPYTADYVFYDVPTHHGRDDK